MIEADVAAPLAAELAAFARRDFRALPERVRLAGRQSIANAVALAVGASDHEAVRLALGVAQGFNGGTEATVLGRRERLAPAWAAFVNGIGVHVEDFDDTHVGAMLHSGAPVVPAALAIAELVDASGEALLEASIVGCELAIRFGLGMAPDLYDRGWHVTGVLGHIGAAIAAGRLLGLSEHAMQHALELAAMQAAGLSSGHGTMTKSFHAGKASADGVDAALRARAGMRGPHGALEGLAVALAGHLDRAAVTDGLGERWEILANAFKPYACGVLGHAIIDGAIALRETVSASEDVREMRFQVHPSGLIKMGIRDPQDSLEAKFSLAHCAAVGFLDGGAGPAQFSDVRARDPQVASLRERVATVVDDRVAKDETRVTARLADGTTWERHVAHATGSAGNPMSSAQLRRKGELLVEPILGGAATRALLDRVFAIEEVTHARELATTTTSGSVG